MVELFVGTRLATRRWDADLWIEVQSHNGGAPEKRLEIGSGRRFASNLGKWTNILLGHRKFDLPLSSPSSYLIITVLYDNVKT
jgi:hypothetical protein